MEPAKEEHVFESMDEFYLFVDQHVMWRLHPALKEFHEAFAKIPQGCKCNKKKRIAAAKQTYIRLKEIDPGIALEFKRIFVAKKIVLKHDGVVLSYME